MGFGSRGWAGRVGWVCAVVVADGILAAAAGVLGAGSRTSRDNTAGSRAAVAAGEESSWKAAAARSVAQQYPAFSCDFLRTPLLLLCLRTAPSKSRRPESASATPRHQVGEPRPNSRLCHSR